ncbi:anti-phage dCTP deaminase [Myxococcus sp. RHSTA-1-4]|uniref:anti-phage dCTP deaminase n=1 Tax=Myxococcus sp. RHSTA-1-4 TaxID=2874601 RepID=UPI001CC1746F|nr:anti-phage dCTP deaminase [Myxococcus sp. RHSTA-1-4]MBZ4415042.1 cytidine deaminase [Myxococcus sp. RHSTA-1-4]
MSAAEAIRTLPLGSRTGTGTGSREILKEHTANELVFAVVGHAGSGTTFIASTLARLLASPQGGSYEVELLKGREVIVDWALERGRLAEPPRRGDLTHTIELQNLGDELRSTDATAVARRMAVLIRKTRAKMQGKKPSPEPVLPDGKPRAYIIDALRHPAEAYLLRSLYRNAFSLVGVVCQEEIRRKRLQQKYPDAGANSIAKFMERDAKDSEKKHGQRVVDTFHLADFFLDNSEDRQVEDGGQKKENPHWKVDEHLLRLVRIVKPKQDTIERPTASETAMHVAYGAQMRSACLSRQVGAALVDPSGNVAATGTNEVPKAGGGVYGQGADSIASPTEHRCAFRPDKYCSNNLEQDEIAEEVLNTVHDIKPLSSEERKQLKSMLRKNSRIGGLLEFSRAVHAEMDALLGAARMGVSPKGCRLFVTTFPCHYCARHLVEAGVDEVQYIEPYPKSRALKLHGDSITEQARDWRPPSQGGTKVLFRPFTGVAPRLYWRAFLKDRELKSSDGRMQIGEPEWGTAWDISKLSYADLETKLMETESSYG